MRSMWSRTKPLEIQCKTSKVSFYFLASSAHQTREAPSERSKTFKSKTCETHATLLPSETSEPYGAEAHSGLGRACNMKVCALVSNICCLTPVLLAVLHVVFPSLTQLHKTLAFDVGRGEKINWQGKKNWLSHTSLRNLGGQRPARPTTVKAVKIPAPDPTPLKIPAGPAAQ
jgi:hypothetical protein